MKDKTKHLPKPGQLLMIDSGEYSDHTVLGFFVVLQNFDPEKELNALLGKKDSNDYDYPDQCMFVSYLINKGYLLEVEYANLYLGGYVLCLEDVSFKPAGNEIVSV